MGISVEYMLAQTAAALSSQSSVVGGEDYHCIVPQREAVQRIQQGGIVYQLAPGKVQHHHAHMCSCMADNYLEGEVIGLVWDGTGLGTVRFLKADTREEVATVTEFGINDPKRLMFIAPTLDEGGYILQIETYFSTSNTLLKQPRTIEYPVTLYVGERPSTGGDSGEEDEERPGGL